MFPIKNKILYSIKLWLNILTLNNSHFLRWDILGAVVGTECGMIESGLSMVFLKDGERKLCTPYMDTTSYGNLRFYFVMGKYMLNKFCWPGAGSRLAPIPEEVKLFVVCNIKWKLMKYGFHWLNKSLWCSHSHQTSSVGTIL